ncbi:MAG: hypothetical protein HY907_18850 [Deltaproteobacteria bacterium]|nr:hypothetical protein [Deltaproteobacteria bacterium]
MGRKDVDRERLHVARDEAPASAGVQLLEHTFVVVTQAFCPASHNLVGAGPTAFDGYPGIAIWVDDGKTQGLVELSPIHGDRSKVGPEFAAGTRLRLECPVCRAELAFLAECSCQPGATLRKLYLNERRDEAHVVGLCDIWGCTRSRVIDGSEILSEWLAGNIRTSE